ncbi:MAG TPA: hypothetical protein GX745_01985 [Clostridiales bacterium]|nr:hypothetical protein [Clostridiales bacterium]
MEILEKIINWVIANWEFVVSCATALIAIISGIISAVKSKNWAKLKDAIYEYVQEAELLDTKGAIKKEVVLSKARMLCVALKLKYDEEKISNLIEAAILLSKTVNARDKDKQNNNQTA